MNLNPNSHPRRRGSAISIVEILLVVTIIAILTSMGGLVYRGVRERAEVGQCMSRMKRLHQFAALYVGDHNTWPYPDHVQPDNIEGWGRAWQQLTEPYGLEPEDLVCPTHQRTSGNPNVHQQPRIDYLATPFSGGRWAPYRWARQPWFIEVGDFHGNGNLIIFPDGHIESLRDIAR